LPFAGRNCVLLEPEGAGLRYGRYAMATAGQWESYESRGSRTVLGEPGGNRAPRVLTPGELKDFRGPVDKLIFSAQEEIDQLYKVVRSPGNTVLFCENAGVVVEHRGNDAQSSSALHFGAASGPRMWRERTALAPALSKSGPSRSTEVNISDRDT
jgi:hypothetical protein